MAAGERVRIKVRVVPRAARNEIAGMREGALVVRVTAAPVEGAANSALLRVLAGALEVAPRELAIERGSKGRDKVVSAPAALAARISMLTEVGR